MGFSIADGGGKYGDAKTTSEQRLQTVAIIQDGRDHAAELGDKYNINTGDVVVTSSNKATIFYFKNNEEYDYIPTALIYNLTDNVGGSGSWRIDITKNPTSGDIISASSSVDIESNSNFGSNKTLTVDAYKYVSGQAVTSGDTVHIATRGEGTGRVVISLGEEVVPQGSSLGVNFTAPAGTTSYNIQVAMAGYLKKFDV